MAILHIASTAAGGTSSGVTTSAIDTTGANLLVLSAGWFNNNPITISDSKGNTWTPLTQRSGGAVRNRLYYCLAPSSVGSGHTFTISGTNIFGSLGVASFSGVASYQAENGATTAGATSLQTGALLPSVNDCLVIAGVAAGAGTPGIDLGFTASVAAFVSGQHASVGIARLIQTTAASVNPTWSWTGSGAAGASLAVFHPTVTGSPKNVMHNFRLRR